MDRVLTGIRILLVEDDPIIALDLRASLEKAGAVIVGPAKTVEKALRLFEREPLDAAVLDVRLGPGNTLELAGVLRGRGVPVLFQTSDPGLVSGRLREIPVLRKPISRDQLVAAVEKLIKKSNDVAPGSIVEEAPIPNAEIESQGALKTRIRQQQLLAELGVIALRGAAFMELLKETVRLSAEGLNAEFCKVLEYLPSESRLLMRAGVGWHPGLVGRATVGVDLASPSGYALHTGKPVISNHLESEERFRTPELLAEHGVRRAINVILQGDGAPYGVLEVDSRSEGEFMENDIAFLQGAANILGMAIERQRHERRLKDALEHQQVLVKEINHRVKNSLQLVSSMLNLQASEDPVVAQQLQEASARIAAIARAHDRLYRGPQVDNIALGQYLKDVCNDLNDVVPHCNLLCEVNDEIIMGTDRAISVALLVTELVSNAAKHAYSEGQHGTIWVTLTKRDNDRAQIVVRDKGVGWPTGFDWKQSRGLGMLLVAKLAEQIDASIEQRWPGLGSEFLIEFSTTPNS